MDDSSANPSDLHPNPPISRLPTASLSPQANIMPVIPAFHQKKTTLDDPRSINTTADQACADTRCRAGFLGAGYTNADEEKNQGIRKSAYKASDSPAGDEESLWPKLDDLPPSSPAVRDDELPPNQSDLHGWPSNEKSEKVSDIRPPARLLPRQKSPSYNDGTKQAQMQVRTKAEVDADDKSVLPSEDEDLKWTSKKVPMREVADHEKLSAMKESYRNSPKEIRLSRVVEESESFTRREFGKDVLTYMSTHSSANHAANLSYHTSYKHSHNHRSLFSVNHSSHPTGHLVTSVSAPAGTAVRTGSAFGLFRRGMSEGGHLGGRRRLMFRWSKSSRKPRSLGHTILSPLVKIRDRYVGCMMGLEGAGDLSGMAGTYATRAQYFADVPLSKRDSRNHG